MSEKDKKLELNNIQFYDILKILTIVVNWYNGGYSTGREDDPYGDVVFLETLAKRLNLYIDEE